MKQPHDWREWRRLRAWYLFQHGWTECEITEALGASKGAVSQWLTLARKGGRHALLSRVRGTHAKLTEEQKRLIPDFLWHGPEASGFRGEGWTCPRVVEVLARELGLAYHRDYLSAMAGLPPRGKLDRLVRRGSVSSSGSGVFLRHLLLQSGKRLLVIWDGWPIRRWLAFRDVVAEEGAERIHLEALPGYARGL